MEAVDFAPILESDHVPVVHISVTYNVLIQLKHVLALVVRSMRTVNITAQLSVTKGLVRLVKCRLKRNVIVQLIPGHCPAVKILDVKPSVEVSDLVANMVVEENAVMATVLHVRKSVISLCNVAVISVL